MLYGLWSIKISNQVCYKKNGCPGVGKLEFHKDDVDIDVPFSSSLNVDSIGKHSQNFPGQWWWCGRWCFIKTPAPAPAQTERKRVTWAVISRKGMGGWKGFAKSGPQVPRVVTLWRCKHGCVVMLFFKVVVLGPFWDMSWKEITQFSIVIMQPYRISIARRTECGHHVSRDHI